MKNYWTKYYQKHNTPQPPSDFAIFCSPFIEEDIIDLGCGTGRDSYFFGLSGKQVLGIDLNIQPVNTDNVLFQKSNFKDITITQDVVYSRFFLHTLKDKEIDLLIQKTPKYFMAECRSTGDKPLLFPNHFRNLIDGDKLLTSLINSRFSILFYQKSRGLAKYKHEDPLVLRVIAKR